MSEVKKAQNQVDNLIKLLYALPDCLDRQQGQVEEAQTTKLTSDFFHSPLSIKHGAKKKTHSSNNREKIVEHEKKFFSVVCRVKVVYAVHIQVG